MNWSNVSIIDHVKRYACWFDKEDAKVVAIPFCFLGFFGFVGLLGELEDRQIWFLLFLVGGGLTIGAGWLVWHLVKCLIVGAVAMALFCSQTGRGVVIYIACWIFAFPVMLVLSILTGLVVNVLNQRTKQLPAH